MYRCELCLATSKPGQPRLTSRVLRADGSIRTELSVCFDCDKELKKGVSVADLTRRHNPAPLLSQTGPVADDQIGTPLEFM